MKLHPVINKILISEQELDNRCKQLGEEISEYYTTNFPNKPLVLLGILKGCVPYMANLMKYISIPMRTEYMVVSSYNDGTVSNRAPQIILDINSDVLDKPILIVEDIIDSGYTLQFIEKHLLNKGAIDVKITTSTIKEKEQVDFNCKWIGFTIPDVFVVGYGLDCAQRFRNLPYIAEVDVPKFEAYDWSLEE